MRIQSDLPLQPLRTIHPHVPLGIIVSILIGGNARVSTVIDPPPITSGTDIALPVSSMISIYVRSVVATTREYMHPVPALITLIYIILTLS